MARPLKPVDLRQVEALARIDCTDAEIAAVLDFTPQGWRKRKRRRDGEAIVSAIEKGRDGGKMSLRRKQFEQAMAGNTTMLIWLGKQRLGQTDLRRVEMDDEASRERVAALEAAVVAGLGMGRTAAGPVGSGGKNARAQRDRTR
jgi:hypothetical protein